MMRCSVTTLMLVTCLFNFGDAVPTFTTPTSGDGSVDLNENVAVDHPVITIEATPSDTKTLGDFTLITQNTPFALAVNGELTVASATIDYEATKTYVLSIQVVDDVPSSATATLTVSVQNVNEAPSFSASSYSVCAEDGSAVGTRLTTFTATDPDAATTLTYSITAGDTNTDFSVATTYLTVAKVLDRSTTPSYTLAVEVSDGALTGSANFGVTVSTTCENGVSARVSSLAALLIGLIYAIDVSLFRN